MHNEAVAVLQGFLDAEYGFDNSAVSPIHIGEVCPSSLTRCWITAWNPLGAPRDGTSNAVAQAHLYASLETTGITFETGFARSPLVVSPRWHEPCAVTTGDVVAELDRLAHDHRQLAIVVCEFGRPARLRCYRRFWQEAFTHSGMDVANVEWVA